MMSKLTFISRCNNKNLCILSDRSDNLFQGDPCKNVYKYVNITYTCSDLRKII